MFGVPTNIPYLRPQRSLYGLLSSSPLPKTQHQQLLLSESVLERVSSPYELLLLYMAYRVTHRQPPVLYGNIPEEVRYAPATTALMTSF